jgi:hypothetical protein
LVVEHKAAEEGLEGPEEVWHIKIITPLLLEAHTL